MQPSIVPMATGHIVTSSDSFSLPLDGSHPNSSVFFFFFFLLSRAPDTSTHSVNIFLPLAVGQPHAGPTLCAVHTLPSLVLWMFSTALHLPTLIFSTNEWILVPLPSEFTQNPTPPLPPSGPYHHHLSLGLQPHKQSPCSTLSHRDPDKT